MKKFKVFLLSLIIILSFSLNVSAEYFTDVIVTGINGIWTDARTYSTLNAAVTAVGANERTIRIVSPQIVTALTIPSNITLEFDRDGSITNSGQLTINTKNIIAPNRQIFTGAGNIDFAPGTEVKTGWFNSVESALALTVNDTVTLIVSKPQTITASYPLGNNVHLKWESPGNILTVNAGVTVSNIGQVEAGLYQIFSGAGNYRFRDGTIINLSWFNNLRAAITHASTNKLTLLIQGTHTVDYSDSIPSTLTTRLVQGGILSISPGITLTYANTRLIDIGSYEHDPFAGTGSVALTDGQTYTPATTLTAIVLSKLSHMAGYEVDALVSYGGGTAYTKATIDATLTAVGVVNKATILLRPGTWVFDAQADYSSYQNVTFKIVPGAVISHGAFTISFGGPVELSVGSLSGTGLVTFAATSVSSVDPDWFVGTDTVKVQYAINSCLANYASGNSNSIPLLVTRKYTLTASVNIDRLVDTTSEEFHIIGRGLDAGFYTASAIDLFSSTIAHTNAPVSEFITFENILFEASANTVNCFVLDGDKFLRMKFLNCYFRKIRCAYSATYLQSFYFSHCNIQYMKGKFLEVTTGGLVSGLVSDIHWTDNIFETGDGTESKFLYTIGTATGCSFNGGLFENATGPFYQATNSRGVSFNGVYFEAVANFPIILSSDIGGLIGSASLTGNYFANSGASATPADFVISCGQMANVYGGGNYSSGNMYHSAHMMNGGDGLVSKGDYAIGNLFDWGKCNRITLALKMSGFAADLDVTGRIEKNGNTITVGFETSVTGTSTTTGLVLTGIPSALLPAATTAVYTTIVTQDNGTVKVGKALVNSTGIICYTDYGATGYTSSGTKGIMQQTITYQLPSVDY